MSGAVPAIPRRTFPSANGGVLARGLVYTYVAGTSTLATTWQDIAMSIPNTNPISLDTTGSCTLWTDPALTYKFVVQNAGGVLQYTLDNVLGSGQSPTLQQSHVDQFSANGVNKSFTLSATPGSVYDTNVYVSGVYQEKSTYSLAGPVLTFANAPALGMGNIEVTYYVLLDFTGLAATIAGYSAAASASASDAQTSALAASTSETNAATSASNAATSETNAASSATGSAASAVAAAGNTPDGRGVSVADYTALRAYAGTATAIQVLNTGIGGPFVYDSTDTTSADNGGTIIVASNGKRWKRAYAGDVQFRWFGPVGDGVADDADARNRAFAYVQGSGRALYVGTGTYRVTTGYTQSTNYGDIFLRGPGRTSELATQGAAVFLLDSTDSASFFLTLSARCTFISDGVNYKCNQFVQDRAFIKLTGPLQPHFISRCDFVNVERPIVYGSATYFQNASLRDVQFSNSGTIHSEAASGTLVGTGLLLDNVNHEGSVPVNTEKVVCNLTGVRNILGTEAVMEGSLPATGWTVLKLDNSYDATYTRAKFADFLSFHSEWTGNAPAKVVDQKGGLARFRQLIGPSLSSVYALSAQARVIIEDTSFSGTTDEPTQFFTKDTIQCVVEFVSCAARTLTPNIPGFIHHNTQWASNTNGQGQVVVSNTGLQKLWAFDGGLFDGGDVSLSNFGGTVANNTDATYGRKLSITPAAGAVNVIVGVKAKGLIKAGDQIAVTFTAKLPNYTAGRWAFSVTFDNVGTPNNYYLLAQAGTVVSGVIFAVATAAPTSTVGLNFSNGDSTGATSDLEIYECTIYHGNDIPRVNVPVFPKAIDTKGTAAPATGSWAVGDRVRHASPVVGSPKAWVCTVAGSPGTWVSEGNL